MITKTITKVIGTIAETTAIFKDSHNNIVDPDIVRLRVKRPSGTIFEISPTKTGTKFFGKILLDEAGSWFFRWSCDGEYASANEFKIKVDDSII